jgi:very-short-patch-repair endonuclease
MEAILWERLRGRRCLNLKFRRQHPIGRFVVDFYCEEIMVAIEIDGGYHQEPQQRKLDLERQLELEERGIRFVRIPANLVSNDTHALMSYLIEVFSLQKGTPLP